MIDYKRMLREALWPPYGIETIELRETVRTQPHYAYGIEPIEYLESRFTREEFRGWLTGNVIKYISRFTRKDGLKDLEKARDYLERLIAFESKSGSAP